MAAQLIALAAQPDLNILLAHQHRLLRDSVTPLLRSLTPLAAVHEAGTFGEAVAFAQKAGTIDMVVMGSGLPGMNGIASIRAFRHRFPSIQLVLLTEEGDPTNIFEAMAAGACGVIFQSISSNAMVSALRLILAGEFYLPSETVAMIVEAGARAGDTASAQAHFSNSEAQVIPLLMDGLCNKVIAHHLGIEEAAVKARLRCIYRKMGVANRSQAVMRLLRLMQRDYAAAAPLALAHA
jgi:DNA-binding NarL/FixJ family response regulator